MPAVRRPAGATAAVLVAVLVALLGAAGARPAAAHILLLQSVPTPGAVVERLDRASFTFSAQLAPEGHLVVAGSDGDERPAERYEVVDASTLVAHFDPPLGAGSVELAWQAVGLDGHRQSGLLTVTVAPAGPGTTRAPTPSAATPSPTTGRVGDDAADRPTAAGVPPAAPGGATPSGSGATTVVVLVTVAVLAVAAALARSRRRAGVHPEPPGAGPG